LAFLGVLAAGSSLFNPHTEMPWQCSCNHAAGCQFTEQRGPDLGFAAQFNQRPSMEFDLLKAFAEHPNRVLSRDHLLDLAHNRDWEPFDRSIDIRIARLRRKIESDPSKPQVIKTVRGAGYIFVPGGEGS
jgi:hypothetical protein